MLEVFKVASGKAVIIGVYGGMGQAPPNSPGCESHERNAIVPGGSSSIMGGREALGIRECGANDRRALERLGHLPEAIATLCPTLYTRLAWAIHRTRVRSFVLDDRRSGALVGSVQFVRSRIDRHTWMFGHWRVSPDERGRGTGGELLRGALQRMAGVARLYSLIEPQNRRSIHAHERLGFERSSNHCGGGPLGFLSTIGPPSPAIGLSRAGRGDREQLFELYQRAMGPLWRRLFPALTAGRFLRAAGDEPPDPAHPGGAAASIRGDAMLVSDAGEYPAFIARGGRRLCLFCDPARCDGALVARVAGALLALGAARDQWLTLRGLPGPLGRRPGPIRNWIVMGTTDVTRLRNGD